MQAQKQSWLLSTFLWKINWNESVQSISRWGEELLLSLYSFPMTISPFMLSQRRRCVNTFTFLYPVVPYHNMLPKYKKVSSSFCFWHISIILQSFSVLKLYYRKNITDIMLEFICPDMLNAVEGYFKKIHLFPLTAGFY